MTNNCYELPIIEVLKSVPRDARLVYDYSPTHSRNIPIGLTCESAVHVMLKLEANLAHQQKLVRVLAANFAWHVQNDGTPWSDEDVIAMAEDKIKEQEKE